MGLLTKNGDPVLRAVGLASIVVLMVAAINLMFPLPRFMLNSAAWVLLFGSFALVLTNATLLTLRKITSGRISLGTILSVLLGSLGMIVAVFMMLGHVPVVLSGVGFTVLLALAILSLIDWLD